MEEYQITCAECRGGFTGRSLIRGMRRKFCNKSCAQSFRNRLRATRSTPEPPTVDGARWLPLTRGVFALVDEADFEDVSRWNWSVHKTSGRRTDLQVEPAWYAKRTGEEKDKKVLLHRHLLQPEPNEKIDHRNGNGLDNRRQNLRKATTSQNGMNSPSKGGASKFKGVYWCRRSSGWRSSIKVQYKQIHLGRFASEDDAARAYDDAARRLHGEFARLNFPDV